MPLPPDNSAALNAAVAAATGRDVITLSPRAYGISAPINGGVAGVTIRGVPGLTRLVKLPASAASGILRLDQTYDDWSFEGIEFDGNERAIVTAGVASPTFTVLLSGTKRVRFRRCAFRDMYDLLSIRDSEDVAFDDCAFYGTQPTGLTPAVDPAAVPDGFYSSGVAVNGGIRRIRFTDCRFHFCGSGIAGTLVSGESGSDLKVDGCTFRADWWDAPVARLRFQAASVDASGPIVLTVSGVSGFQAAFNANNVVSFRRGIATGSAFTQIFVGNVMAAGTPFADAAVGDAIETADGRRAAITSLVSSASVNVEGWEWIDTYEPCDPPSLSTSWRLSRYYASGTTGATGTTATLYSDPVNPYSGERAIADAGLDLATLPARVLAKTTYSGIHINGYISGVAVTGNTFRGSWADQCSMFDLGDGAKVQGNRFLYGQDEGITLTRCPGSIVASNSFTNCGASAIFVGGGDGSSVTANTVIGWGVVNPAIGAIDAGALGLVIQGNTGIVPHTSPARDWCRYLVRMSGSDSTGSLISGNFDGGATVSTLYADTAAAPGADAITARDSPTVSGPGAGNVSTGDSSSTKAPLVSPVFTGNIADSNGSGGSKVLIGDAYPASAGSYGGIGFGISSFNSTNFAFLGDGSDLLVNAAGAGGGVYFRCQNVSKVSVLDARITTTVGITAVAADAASTGLVIMMAPSATARPLDIVNSSSGTIFNVSPNGDVAVGGTLTADGFSGSGTGLINVVHTSGTENVDGQKTFTTAIIHTNLALAPGTSAAGFVAYFGADATLGALGIAFGCHVSAAGASRYGFVTVGDDAATRPLILNCNGGGAFGNVGIGLTNPSARLSVVSSTTGLIASFGANNVDGLLQVSYNAEGLGDTELKSSVNGPMALFADGDNDILMKTTGIGKVTVSRLLQMPNGIADSSAANDSIFKGSDHSNKWCIKDAGGTVHELW